MLVNFSEMNTGVLEEGDVLFEGVLRKFARYGATYVRLDDGTRITGFLDGELEEFAFESRVRAIKRDGKVVMEAVKTESPSSGVNRRSIVAYAEFMERSQEDHQTPTLVCSFHGRGFGAGRSETSQRQS